MEPLSQPQTPRSLSVRGVSDIENNGDREGEQAETVEEPEMGELGGLLERTGLETLPETPEEEGGSRANSSTRDREETYTNSSQSSELSVASLNTMFTRI